MNGFAHSNSGKSQSQMYVIYVLLKKNTLTSVVSSSQKVPERHFVIKFEKTATVEVI